MGRAVIAHSITNSVGRRFSLAHAALMRPDSRADAHTSTVYFPPGLEYSSLLAFHLEQSTVAPLSRLNQTSANTQRVRRKESEGGGFEEAQTSAAGGQQFRVSALSTWTCRFFFGGGGRSRTHTYLYTHLWKEGYTLYTRTGTKTYRELLVADAHVLVLLCTIHDVFQRKERRQTTFIRKEDAAVHRTHGDDEKERERERGCESLPRGYGL